MRLLLNAFLVFVVCVTQDVQAAKRLRDYGVTFGDFATGKHNAITDVKGVRVGQVTIKKGRGKLIPGKGPVRTGVTVILPSERGLWDRKFMAGSFVLNGNGEAMGLMWIKESGILETPIALTNTLNVADVQKGLLEYMMTKHKEIGIKDDTLTPVVLECDDSGLNDIRGMHVKPRHVLKAIETASSTKVEEGGVGAGTGMIGYEFKGGIGTSSRKLSKEQGGYTVGVLVNVNHGDRKHFMLKGVPVGKMIPDNLPKFKQDGSVIVIIATDAPLDSRQLSRVAKRAMLGLARTGAIASHGSGDVAIAFSTANTIPHYPEKPTFKIELLSDFFIKPVFEAAADATEEAVTNAVFAGETTYGRSNNMVPGLPKKKVLSLLKKHLPAVP